MWRRALRICKAKIGAYKKALTVFCAMLTGFIFCNPVFAQDQSSVEMPEMPDMPSMPQIGGSFYKPSFPSGFGSRKNKNETDNDDNETNASVLTEAVTPESLLSTVYSNSGILTAYDISALYDSGLFDNISSLNSQNSLTNYSTTTSTNLLLQQVLNSLNELKNQQQSASARDKNRLDAVKTDSENFKIREPSILRFKINGFNILDSLTDVFFSETEADGTFLLTGDRKYFINQQVHTETFYMLFKTVSSNGSSLTYKVQASIVQNSRNENSYVYKLANVKNLTAEKTGNLVVMHFSGDSLSADILLDIDCD